MEWKVNHGTKKNLFSLLITVIVISILVLSGPAKALTVDLTQPNDAIKGEDVSFDITIDITSPDTYVPIQYTEIIFTGPSYSETCKVNIDGTDNCPDVDVSIISFEPDYGYGYGYGYDTPSGYGYNFGYGYGYGYIGNYGKITYHVVWHTPTTLVAGTYDVQGKTFVEGDVASHTFSSSIKSFLINEPAAVEDEDEGTGGGRDTLGGGFDPFYYTRTLETTEPEEETPTTPHPGEITPPTEDGGPGIIGGIIGALPTSAWIIIITVLIVVAAFLMVKVKRRRKIRAA
jgi:hypothetical protein